jgi:hypothetical protein
MRCRIRTAHDASWCAVCAAARSEIREPNAGIGRITAFSFSAEANGRARRDRSAIDGGIAAGIPPCDWNCFGHDLERRRAPRSRQRNGAARRGKASLAGASTPPASFFPRACRVQRIPSPGAGREGIGLSSQSLIARRYRRTLAVEFAAHYIY